MKADINRKPSREGLKQLESMDPVRRWVAATLHHAFVTSPDRPPEPVRPACITSVSGEPASGSVIMVTVTQDNGTTRQFIARLNETH